MESQPPLLPPVAEQAREPVVKIVEVRVRLLKLQRELAHVEEVLQLEWEKSALGLR